MTKGKKKDYVVNDDLICALRLLEYKSGKVRLQTNYGNRVTDYWAIRALALALSDMIQEAKKNNSEIPKELESFFFQ